MKAKAADLFVVNDFVGDHDFVHAAVAQSPRAPDVRAQLKKKLGHCLVRPSGQFGRLTFFYFSSHVYS